MNGTQRTLQKMNTELNHYLNGSKFKGTILIKLDCNDGGIGNVNIYVEHSIKRKKIKK